MDSGWLRSDSLHPAQMWNQRQNPEDAFTFAHGLAQHPLFTLEALAGLADRMDPAHIEVAPIQDLTVVESRQTDRLDAPGGAEHESPGDVVRNAERDRRWMSMRHIETDAVHGPFVRGLFAEFCAEADAGNTIFQPEGYVFISASNSVTPAHVDHEHNFFFHIHGTKHFTTGTFADARLEHRTFESMYSGGYGSTSVAPVAQRRHRLEPGRGLYVPPTAVHFVENDSGLAISFSLVFHDPALDRAAKVYAANADLRALGLRPRPPGESVPLDAAKAAAVTTWRRVRSLSSRP